MRGFSSWLAIWAAVGSAHPLDRFPVVDFAGKGLPPVSMGGRVMELFDGEHLDVILRDTPDEMRPPSIVAFYGHKSCPNALADLEFESLAETKLPSRERLLIAKYDMDAAPKRGWYEWVPEMDLVERFQVTACPTLVFVPRSCDGWTEWCVRESDGPKQIMGCKDFKESCPNVELWDGSSRWLSWVQQLVEREGEPQLSPVLENYKTQHDWLLGRDQSTSGERGRIAFLPPAIPSFSEFGYKILPTPPEMQTWLTDFYYKHKHKVKTEPWQGMLTQNSFHVTKMRQVDLDLETDKKIEIGDKYLKPILEEWTGVDNLEYTSIYGIREYDQGHWLSTHVDREDTHVISATFCIDKVPASGPDGKRPEHDSWPLEFTDWKGQRVRYEHPPGTVILYESIKGAHGRPYRNPDTGVHLGAFFHYRPPKDFMDWSVVIADAKKAIRTNSEYVKYKAPPVVEPEVPVFTAKRYFEGTRGDPLGERTVKFYNENDVPLTLFWTNGDTATVQCSPVVKGTYCEVQTRPDHEFFWTRVMPDVKSFETQFRRPNIPEALPNSYTVVDRKKISYKFEFASDYVVFNNKGDVPLTLFWTHPQSDTANVQCSPVLKDEPCMFTSHDGHHFFWTLEMPDVESFVTQLPKDVPVALPGSHFVVELPNNRIQNFQYTHDEL